jgi:DNA polymerase
MDDTRRLSEEDIARQVRQHVDALRAAGIEWAPAATQKDEGGRMKDEQDRQFSDSSRHGEPATLVSHPSSLFEAPPADIPSPDVRRQELTVLAQVVSACTRCSELASTRKQTVFGVGRVDPDVCFVGEAPGADEDAQGEPFVGAAGQLLNKIIAACGMKREDVYICNILRCRPPGNRLPMPDEAAHCREFLEKQLDLVRPRFLCALGACAAQNLLGTTLSIGKLRGQIHTYRGIPVLCTYHPAYLLRSPDKKKDVWQDMKKLMAKLGKPIK